MLRTGQKSSTNMDPNSGISRSHAGQGDPFSQFVDPEFLNMALPLMGNIGSVAGNFPGIPQMFDADAISKKPIECLYKATSICFTEFKQFGKPLDQLEKLALVCASWLLNLRTIQLGIRSFPHFNKPIMLVPMSPNDPKFRSLVLFLYWSFRYAKMPIPITENNRVAVDYINMDMFFDGDRDQGIQAQWHREMCFLNMASPKVLLSDYEQLAKGISQVLTMDWFDQRFPLIIIGSPMLINKTRPNPYVMEFCL